MKKEEWIKGEMVIPFAYPDMPDFYIEFVGEPQVVYSMGYDDDLMRYIPSITDQGFFWHPDYVSKISL